MLCNTMQCNTMQFCSKERSEIKILKSLKEGDLYFRERRGSLFQGEEGVLIAGGGGGLNCRERRGSSFQGEEGYLRFGKKGSVDY